MCARPTWPHLNIANATPEYPQIHHAINPIPCDIIPSFPKSATEQPQTTYLPTYLLPPLQHHIRIPTQQPLIPPHRSNPTPGPKKTPIHARRELRMAIHHAQLHPRPDRLSHPSCSFHWWLWLWLWLRLHSRPIRPQPHRHVVTRTNQNIRRMRTPRQPAHRVLVAQEERHRPARRIPDVEGADRPVDAPRRDDRLAVLVPVVG